MGLDGTQTDGTTTDAADAANTGTENQDGAQQDGGGGNDQIANLNIALRQAREEAKAAKTALAERTAAEEEAARKAAEEAGQYEKLYGEEKARADTALQRLQALEERENTRLAAVSTDADAIVAKWPEADRALDPKGLDPDSRLRMVRQLDARLNSQERPAGTRNNGHDGKEPIPDWVKANYKEFHAGVDAPNDDALRRWMGHLKTTTKYRDKFTT